MWDLPGPGLEPVSPALAGGFLNTASPGKSIIGNVSTKGSQKYLSDPLEQVRGGQKLSDWPKVTQLVDAILYNIYYTALTQI